MTGSLGTLGVLTEISLKCLPLPAVETTRVLECAADEAIRRVNEWSGQPLPLSATCWLDGRLCGAPVGRGAGGRRRAATRSAARRRVDAERFWASVRDHTHPFFATLRAAGDAPLWRLSVKLDRAVPRPRAASS